MTEEYTVDFKMVNGIPGVIVTINNKVTYVLSFAFEDEKISNIYMMVNPEKLMHLNVKI
ncbi:RNA polymerase sigma-70 factor, ECF subfamily [Bacillus cereus]|nr:RNA polymerase sigma-70 factor, ECF subfamily [Bacillus cereus]